MLERGKKKNIFLFIVVCVVAVVFFFFFLSENPCVLFRDIASKIRWLASLEVKMGGWGKIVASMKDDLTHWSSDCFMVNLQVL